MIIDEFGRPIKPSTDSEAARGTQLDLNRPTRPKRQLLQVSTGPAASQGQTLDNGLQAKLKSQLLTRLAQQRQSVARTTTVPIVQRGSRVHDTIDHGKEYPGSHTLLGMRALAWSSTVVMSIVSYRRNQLTKREIGLRPTDDEPAFRFNLLEYSPSDILRHPAFDDIDKFAILDIFRRIDPFNEHQRKLKRYSEVSEELSANERSMMEYLNEKHLKFHRDRTKDIKNVLKLLRDPDPYFSEESSWYYLLSNVLEDLLLLDRGVIIKVRNKAGDIIALAPVDGATIRPVVGDHGFITHYTQVLDGEMTRSVITKEDIILFRMNMTPDAYMYGYGVPNMDILWNTVLSDLFIDKGNIDYYRKGGSVPEGFLAVEPPGNDDDIYTAYEKDDLDAIQRQMQAIIASDFTQIPIISGGKFTWIDLKGKRRDMQFHELAEYLTRKICAVFQVSPIDVGVLQDANRSTAETQASMSKSKGLDTLAATISHYVTRYVVNELRKEEDLKLHFAEDDQESIGQWWQTVQGQLQTGYRSINEVKAEQGEDPVPWGDTPMVGLQNWNPSDGLNPKNAQGGAGGSAPMPPGMGGEPQPQGAPGAPGGIPGGVGGAPLPPAGMEQLMGAASPQGSVGVPSQLAGGVPNMAGGELKSVLADLLEPAYGEEYRTMDVSGLLKNIVFADVPGIDGIVAGLDTDVEDIPAVEHDLMESVETYLMNSIKKVAIVFDSDAVSGAFSSPEHDVSVQMQVTSPAFNTKNFFKLASYFFQFDNNARLSNFSADLAVMNLISAVPMSELGEEGSYLRSVTSILKNIGIKDYVKLVFVREESDFSPGATVIEEGDTCISFARKVTGASQVAGLAVSAASSAIRSDIGGIILDSLSNEGTWSVDIGNMMLRYAVNDELEDEILSYIEKNDKRMARYYRKLGKYGNIESLSGIVGMFPEFSARLDEDIQAIVGKNSSRTAKHVQNVKEAAARLAFVHLYGMDTVFFSDNDKPVLSNAQLLVYLRAAIPELTDGLLSDEELMNRLTEIGNLRREAVAEVEKYATPADISDPLGVLGGELEPVAPLVGSPDQFSWIDVFSPWINRELEVRRTSPTEFPHGAVVEEVIDPIQDGPLDVITTVDLDALPPEYWELDGEMNQISTDFQNYVCEFLGKSNPFHRISERIEDLVMNSVSESCAMILLTLGKLDDLKFLTEDRLRDLGIGVDLVLADMPVMDEVSTLDGWVSVVATEVTEALAPSLNVAVVEGIVSKALSGEPLDSFQANLVKLKLLRH